jgi:hypothetical protein
VAAVSVVAVLTTRSGGDGSACPDRSYGCVEAGPGEPLVIGTLFPTDRPGRSGVEALVEAAGPILGRSIRVLAFDGRCSAEAAAHAAREFATGPPEGQAVVGVVGESCPEAEITAARILDKSGIAFVSILSPSDVPATVAFHLGWAGPAEAPAGLSGADRTAFAVARVLRAAVARVAVRAGEEVLVPRTRLRDALLEAGLRPAP